jgi:hypothetical protein
MGNIFHYQCDRCSELVKLRVGIHGYYCTPDAIPPMLHCQKAWCFGCSSLTQAEKLLSPDQLIEYHRSISKINQDMSYRYGRSKKTIEILQQRYDGQLESGLRLHKFRRSPPRCLSCGSTHIQYYSIEESRTGKYMHPNCGGYFIHSKPDRFLHVMWADCWLTIDGLCTHNLSTVGRLKYYLQYIWYFLLLYFSH